MENDFDKSCFKFRWKAHFNTHFNDNPPDNPYYSELTRALVKSKNTSPIVNTKFHGIELFISKYYSDIFINKPTSIKAYDNLTEQRRAAVKAIKSWKNIEIRLFDKGSGFVLLHKSDYENHMLEKLNSPNYSIMLLSLTCHICMG